MKQVLKYQRILILSLLSISVLTPIIFFSGRLSDISTSGHKGFVEDLSSHKYRTDTLKLNAIIQETVGLKEPTLAIYKARDIESVDSSSNIESVSGAKQHESLNELGKKETVGFKEPTLAVFKAKSIESVVSRNVESVSGAKQHESSNPLGKKGLVNQTAAREDNGYPQTRRITDEKIREMRDQVIRAKAYLSLVLPNSNSHLVKELKLRMRDIERAIGEATRDSDLPRSALQKMKNMETVLAKAGHVYHDCSLMTTKLRAMTYNAEEQVRTQKSQATYLVQLASRTTSKGLHCLSMRLTADYFALQPEKRILPNQQRLHDTELYHYAVFSDNVLACAVVVNSTISASLEPKKVVIHVVTDALNLPAISMWFLMNPPKQATIEIKSIDDFGWLASKYGSTAKVQDSSDPRYNSPLNYLRFYLPELFPELSKIVLLDHDVVVQRDLKELWNLDMKGKVNGAVQTCRESDPSFRRMDMLINFSDLFVAEKFDRKACTWAFGMNLFDLKEWRRQNLTALYHHYVELGKKKDLWKGGSLPLGLVTFYNQTFALDRRWHALGLGYESGVGRGEVERAAVIHYDGSMKPWLEIGIGKFKSYWSKHLKYDHPFLQQCNIHE